MTELLNPAKRVNLAFGIAVLVGLYFTSGNYLLFHSLVEIFSIVIACGMFMVAWNSRSYFDNNYLLFIGIAYLFVGGLDLVHTLAYKGMGVFPGAETNLPTQLWIAARYTESLSLLMAPFFFSGRLRAHLILLAYALACSLVLMTIFYWEIFPVCFVEGSGLTTFKKGSEYAISLILLASILLVGRHRDQFDGKVFGLVVWSIILTIGSELSFTFYIHAYGFSNWVGHILKIASFYLIYKAVIETGLAKPYDLLFRGLKESTERFQLLSETAERLLAAENPQGIVDDLCRRVMEHLDCQVFFNFLAHEPSGRLRLNACAGIPDEEAHKIEWLDCTEAVCGSAARNDCRIVAEDILHTPDLRADLVKSYGIRAYACHPIVSRGTVIGTLSFGTSKRTHFTADELGLMKSVTNQIAVAMDRIRAQKTLRESEERYRNLFSSMTEGFAHHEIICDSNGKPCDYRFLEVNPAFERQTGLKADDLVGRTLLEAIPAAEPIWVERYGRVAMTGESANFEAWTQALGRWFDVHAFCTGPARFAVVFRDITGRKLAEDEREGWITRLNTLVRVGADVVAAQNTREMLDRVVDAAGLVTRAEVASSGYGYGEKSFQVRSTFKSADAPAYLPSSLFEMEGVDFYLNLMDENNTLRLTDEEFQNHPHRRRLPDDHASLGGLLGTQLVGRDGEPKGLILVSHSKSGGFTQEDELLLHQLAYLASTGLQHLEAREALGKARDELELQVQERTADLARANAALMVENQERKRAEETLRTYNARLEQSNRDLEEFAFVASHDLQEPLRKIRTFGDRLRVKCAGAFDDSGEEYLDRMQNAAQRMQVLIRDLLQFSRVTTAAKPFTMVDLTRLAHEVVDDLAAAIEQSEARVEIDELATIEADPSQMRQLFQNLIGNAVKYRGAQTPVIKIQGASRETEVAGSKSYQIRVEDNGIGFEEKYLGRIFKPFQRLHGRSDYPGTGMGLAICRRIVERHNGSINAKSTLGEGSVFIVTVPFKQPEGADP